MTGLEVTTAPTLSVTWISKDQAPTVVKAPVEVEAGDVQDEDEEPSRLL